MTMKKRARNDLQKEQRRLSIVLAADALFRERGGRLSSIAEVAKGAGIAKGTTYLYFRNKDELYMAVLEHRARMWGESVIETLAETERPFRVRDVVQAITEHVIDNNEVLVLATIANSVLDHGVDREEEMRFRAELARMTVQVGGAITEGMPEISPARGTALFLRSLAYILGMWQLIAPSSIMDKFHRRHDLEPFMLHFARELESGLTALWHGAIGADTLDPANITRSGRGLSCGKSTEPLCRS